MHTLLRLLRSFGFAFSGFKSLVSTQPNARFHLLATFTTIAAGCLLRISRSDWTMIALAIGMVWTAEAMNMALEFLADEISLERRERIRIAKDVAAFGVLASALAA